MYQLWSLRPGCGTQGHWQGDPECPQSSSSTGKGSDKKGQTKRGSNKSAAKKVLTVEQPGGGTREVSFGDPVNEETYGTFFTYVVSLPSTPPCDRGVWKQFSHYLVLDTACQRTCCSTTWIQCWEEHVHHLSRG